MHYQRSVSAGLSQQPAEAGLRSVPTQQHHRLNSFPAQRTRTARVLVYMQVGPCTQARSHRRDLRWDRERLLVSRAGAHVCRLACEGVTGGKHVVLVGKVEG